MIVLSIDSGLEKTGYAIFEKKHSGTSDIKYLDSALILTKKTLPKAKRLEQIYSTLEKILEKYHPDHIVMEQLFFLNNQKTAIAVAQAQGAVMLLAAQNNIEIEFMAPLNIKQIITGYGRADKKSVQKMLRLTLHLDSELKQDDVADAIACGLAYCYQNQNLLR